MKTPLRLLAAPALLLFAALALPGALHAQLPKIFVASFGNDANDGSRGAPKRNFQAAHDAVAADGQIVVLDTAGYGALSITKSVTITVPPGVNGFVSVTGSADAITINAAGVVLRGLIIEGGGQGPAGTGIYGLNVTNLVVDNCTVRNFRTGVQSSTGGANLSLNDSLIIGCYDGVIVSGPAGTLNSASIQHTRFELNGRYGVRALSNISSGGVGASIVAMSGCVLRKNGDAALHAENASSTTTGSFSSILISDCSITENENAYTVTGKGYVYSRGNNTVENNRFITNSFSGTYQAK